jgi:hypothetical protein
MKWEAFVKEEWAESFAVLFAALGFIIAIFLRSPYYSYLSVFLGGFISARLFYIKKPKEPILPFVLIIVGFLFGYLLGAIWVNRFVVLISFAIGFGISAYLHKKKILGIFKSELFLK